MWLCYTIRKEDSFKHLSLITENLQDIYDFITNVTNIDSEGFDFEIERKNKNESTSYVI